ncbi:helix-turn-helix domain-containing protein [Symmachiella dynata]|uniref:Helix-turn-helix protein n=1 Tax=Symmachiella dynata TaxID=2527995 RepID=A0A517ZKF0_9PLAN|nr:helix-turn-helix transcriptional regulator [Symmachiella dynata]QDT47378.1 helix-turn-helix protein [Symmachiella dynata]QDU42948.1 helix-turn-helix protein [Symmachiella dynata]
MAYVEAGDIQEILDSLKIRAAELARRTHVSRSYLSHLLSGRKSNPSKLWALQVLQLCREEHLEGIAERIQQRVEPAKSEN